LARRISDAATPGRILAAKRKGAYPLTCYKVTRYISLMSDRPSLLQMSAAARLAWALGACAVVWAAVAWAVL
jgi:hypothetical protein